MQQNQPQLMFQPIAPRPIHVQKRAFPYENEPHVIKRAMSTPPLPLQTSEEKPHKCPEPGCQMSFTRIHDLKRHQRIHLGQKPHTCPHCYKSFTRKDSLVRHLKSSTTGACASSKPGSEIDSSSVAGTPHLADRPFIDATPIRSQSLDSVNINVGIQIARPSSVDPISSFKRYSMHELSSAESLATLNARQRYSSPAPEDLPPVVQNSLADTRNFNGYSPQLSSDESTVQARSDHQTSPPLISREEFKPDHQSLLQRVANLEQQVQSQDLRIKELEIERSLLKGIILEKLDN